MALRAFAASGLGDVGLAPRHRGHRFASAATWSGWPAPSALTLAAGPLPRPAVRHPGTDGRSRAAHLAPSRRGLRAQRPRGHGLRPARGRHRGGGHLETLGTCLDAPALFPPGDVARRPQPAAPARRGPERARRPRRRPSVTCSGPASRSSGPGTRPTAVSTGACCDATGRAGPRRRVPRGVGRRSGAGTSTSSPGCCGTTPTCGCCSSSRPPTRSTPARRRSRPRRGAGLRPGPRLDGVSGGRLWLLPGHQGAPAPGRPPRRRAPGRPGRPGGRAAGLRRPAALGQRPRGGDAAATAPAGATLYDVTDDWLHADAHRHTSTRGSSPTSGCSSRQSAHVVVCSPALLAAKARRP